jgi:hypothetical protein
MEATSPIEVVVSFAKIETNGGTIIGDGTA